MLATVLVMNPAVPARNLQERVALAQAKPGTLNYGSAGNGSMLHPTGELMVSETGIDMKHVPCRGTGLLVTDLIGGQLRLGFVSVSQAAPHVKFGALRALAVPTTRRSAALSDVPTMAEAGAPRYGFDAWNALGGPARPPKALVDDHPAAIKAALGSAEASRPSRARAS